MTTHAGHGHSTDLLPRLLELDAELHHLIVLAASDAVAAVSRPVIPTGSGCGPWFWI
jgi:hypothetical protein